MSGLVVCAMLAVSAPAQTHAANDVWFGDLAAARAFLADTGQAHQRRGRAEVTVKAVGTMTALENVALGRADLVGTARPADPDTAVEQKLQFHTVAWDGLAILAHPRNRVRNLSLVQLRDIYAGQITNWSQLGGTPGAINLYAVAGPLDGVEWSLRRLLFGKGSAPVAAKRWYINTRQLEGAIAIDPAAIGVTLNSAIADDRALSVISIDGVAPSLATLRDGSYVLATRLYLAARREAPGVSGSVQLASELRRFMRSERVLVNTWRKRQLLPAANARRLREGTPAREALIGERLGVNLARTAPAPVIPAPAKSMRVNRPQHADQTTLRQPPLVTDTTRGAGANPAAAVIGALQDLCRPAPLCS